jgi:uncharacterized protein
VVRRFLCIAEVLSALLIGGLTPILGAEMAEALFSTAPMPPMPLYLLAGTGAALVIIALSVMVADRFREARWLQPLVAVGQLALTIYVAHVVIGMGGLEVLGILENQPLAVAVTSALIFYGLMLVFAAWWRARYRRGPLEWIMRRVTA